MRQGVWIVRVEGRGGPPVYRRSFCYRSQQRLSLHEAIDLATIARLVGGPVVVTHRGRRCDATDPSDLFLLGIAAGDRVKIELTGPVTTEVLVDLEQLLEQLNAACDQAAG
ncbi:MAG: hypothetical protein JWO38_4289 [Gemmataceae bacterium]|nr:hypothetical protein [Gemmataceae bacterium]